MQLILKRNNNLVYVSIHDKFAVYKHGVKHYIEVLGVFDKWVSFVETTYTPTGKCIQKGKTQRHASVYELWKYRVPLIS